MKIKAVIQEIIQGLIIGFMVGTSVSLFRFLLVNGEQSLAVSIAFVHEHTYGMILWMMILTCGYVVLRWMIHKEPKLARGGIPVMEQEMIQSQDAPNWRLLIMKPVACVVSVLCGLSVGRGGPAYQIGALCSDYTPLVGPRLSRSVMLACGAGAGIAAAFGAPLAALCFMRERQRTIHNEISYPALCGAIISASLISIFCFGKTPLILVGGRWEFTFSEFGVSLLIILVCMTIGNGYRYLLRHGVGWLNHYFSFSLTTTIGFAFVLSFFMMGFFPQVLGSGISMVPILQPASPLIWSLLILILVKMVYSLLCFVFGAPGGIFFPTLMIGGCLGLLIGSILYEVNLIPITMLSTCIILGMSGFFTAVIQTPLAASLLCVELSSGWRLLPIILFVTISVRILSKMCHIHSVYDHIIPDNMEYDDII